MTPTLATGIDSLSDWRAGVLRRLADVAGALATDADVHAATLAHISRLRDRLDSDRLIVAFVAEFSRGKSELINAIFFSDIGRRVLPAAPGRTTMCPVELAWHADRAPSLRLLPIESRRASLTLAELRLQPQAWTEMPLDLADPERVSACLQEVTRTRAVTPDEAQLLGFWDDTRPAENPPLRDDGLLELPAWRHALVNYPHPLLQRGLVVLDTPGLNAVGAEPELTLSLLPSAHATVFILAADTGVTKSDLSLWRDHLGSAAVSRFVALNKVDTLLDPLATPAEVAAQIDLQRRNSARLLGIAPERVFPLSARQGLAARISGDDRLLAESRLPDFELALTAGLLPQRRELLANVILDAANQIEADVARRTSGQRRQFAEQMLELRGLRGKSGGKLRLMLRRVVSETSEFEECSTRLQAMRAVHRRMLKVALAALSADRLHEHVAQAQTAMTATLLNRGARRAFLALCDQLRGVLVEAHQRGAEIREMLEGSWSKLNAEFGFSLAVGKGPDVGRFADELAPIERDCAQYLSLSQSLRLSNPQVMEQFRRILISRLRVVFEGAGAELDMWSRQTSAQVVAQLSERRRGFQSRREALERIQAAAGELESRIAEIEAHDQGLQTFVNRARELVQALRDQARGEPTAAFEGSILAPPLQAQA